ncbi:hypothetical protein LguiA_008044 [Lonicera macranthoides]
MQAQGLILAICQSMWGSCFDCLTTPQAKKLDSRLYLITSWIKKKAKSKPTRN